MRLYQDKTPFRHAVQFTADQSRVEPLARLKMCGFIPSPLSEHQRVLFKAMTGNRPNNRSIHTHFARMIEVLHCAELMKELLEDETRDQGELERGGKCATLVSV